MGCFNQKTAQRDKYTQKASKASKTPQILKIRA